MRLLRATRGANCGGIAIRAMVWRKWVTFAVGLVMSLISNGPSHADAERMQRLDFTSSTQRMGVRLTERLRDLWRRRWFRLHK